MKINMQIVLSQADIASAIRNYVRSELPLQEGQDIIVTLGVGDEKEIYAIAVTDKAEVPVEETKPTRTRRTKAQIQADEEAANGTAQAEPEAPEPAAEAAAEEDDNTPPFDIGTPALAANHEAELVAAIEAAPAITTPNFQIFPNASSSAPALAQPEIVPPVPTGKSLFANLPSPTTNH